MVEAAPISQRLVPLPLQLTPVPLISNFYTPSFNQGTNIHVYAIHYVPEVDNENRALRRDLLRSADEPITKLVGGHIVSGINLFAVRENRETMTVPCMSGSTSYTMRLQYARTVSLAVAQGQKDTHLVLNVIIKRALREMGLLQVTRLPKYYDPAGTKSLPELGIEIWRGYTTELTLREGVPIINIDFSSKIIHTRSFMDELQDVRSNSQGGDWVNQAKSELEGRIVMVKYGNRRCYRVDEICMNKNPTQTFDKNGVPITYVDYFQRQYGVTISDKRQPLLRSHIRKRLEEFDIYLIPELVTLTGLDDAMRADYKFMATIAETTRLEPQQRLNVSKRLADGFNDREEVKKVFRDFAFNISRAPIQVNSYNVSGESVYINGNRTIPIGGDGNFQVRDNILEPIDLRNWVIMATDRDQRNADQFAKALHHKLMEIGINVTDAEMLPYDPRTFDSTVQKMTRQGGLQIVVILLPKNKKKDYERIKKTTTTIAVVPTQVVMVPINEKRFNSIIEKVALQIQAKVGAQLWTVRPSAAFGRYLMVIGIDVFHDTVLRSKSVLGFCATIHPNLSKYYSTIAMHESGQEIATAIGSLFIEAINAFKQKAKRFPDAVIFFRDGVAETQIDAVKEMEVESVLRACQQVRDGAAAYSPNLIYTVVVKKTSARFFAPAGTARGGGRGRGRGGRGGGSTASGEVSNPPPGTLVIGQVVPERGDFYLISHFANQGMSAPSLYRTVYASNPGSFQLEELARLAYKLCHMYYNWSGAIKVPAPCMMAHKIAFLVGQCVHGAVDVGIRLSPFYL